ncbi:ABC transporter permease [Roseibium marinum]|uniref:NitT/TauT family transport system permease protein n=1 Tax=Roseibium marinum TaxID=281252 RepID=A0A2S3UYZ6_9HYPH|nr:ABC transporter permease [Roseibium marinum]POF32689.1 NitT/TauT family transport system permease protein [Roseibium marinum]
MFLRSLLGLAGFVALWGAAVPVFNIPSYLLPGPIEVFDRICFLFERAELAGHIQVTVLEIFWGFLLGTFTGIVSAIVFARIPVLLRIFTPLILLLQTVPKIAIAPLLLLWLGLGLAPKVVLVAIVSYFPVMTAMLSGLRYIDKSFTDLAGVLRLTPWQRFWHVELPSALPGLFAGATVASTLAMTAAVIGELMGANKGMGFMLATGQENADTATVIGMVILLAFLGWAFFSMLEYLRKRMEDRFS